jgi:hypothetical protein
MITYEFLEDFTLSVVFGLCLVLFVVDRLL